MHFSINEIVLLAYRSQKKVGIGRRSARIVRNCGFMTLIDEAEGNKQNKDINHAILKNKASSMEYPIFSLFPRLPY